MSKDTKSFYNNVPTVKQIYDIAEIPNYKDVPNDWLVVTADVKGSTKLAAEGRYKDVNAVAASLVVALLNITKDVDIPFIFGGDGASILIPPNFEHEAKDVLLDTQKLAKDSFEINLRVGIVPVKDVLKDGYKIKVAKLKMHGDYYQAVFIGGGISYAEDLLKASDKYRITGEPKGIADYSGFECRWDKINTHKDETLALMIKVLDESSLDVYNIVLLQIEKIFGNKDSRHPLNFKNLKLAFSPKLINTESKVKNKKPKWLNNLFITCVNLGVSLVNPLNLSVFGYNWNKYKRQVILASDNEKFDDALRMVISCTEEQRKQLVNYLEVLRTQGKIVYGYHSSNATLITCVVFNLKNHHMHFVDGANGGYTHAAKMMKKFLKFC